MVIQSIKAQHSKAPNILESMVQFVLDLPIQLISLLDCLQQTFRKISFLQLNYPKEQNDQKKIQYLTKAYKQELLPLISEQFSQEHLDKLPHESEILDNDSDKLMNQNSQHLNSFWKQLKLLLHRGFVGIQNDQRVIIMNIISAILIGLVTVAVFFDLSDNQFVTQLSLAGCMYFMLGYIVFTMINTTIMTFHDERPVFLREHSNGMYSIKAYFLAKTILDIPQMAFIPLLFSLITQKFSVKKTKVYSIIQAIKSEIIILITYFGIGLTVTASQFFYFYLILFLVTMCSASYGYFLSVCFKREEDAVGAVSLIFLIVSMFGGFLANSSNYPDWIGWFQYLSPIRYGMEALVRNDNILINMTNGFLYQFDQFNSKHDEKNSILNEFGQRNYQPNEAIMLDFGNAQSYYYFM